MPETPADNFRLYYVSKIVPAINRRHLLLLNGRGNATPWLTLGAISTVALIFLLAFTLTVEVRVPVQIISWLGLIIYISAFFGMVLGFDQLIAPSIANEIVRERIAETMGWTYRPRKEGRTIQKKLRALLHMRSARRRSVSGVWQIAVGDRNVNVFDAEYFLTEAGKSAGKAARFRSDEDNPFRGLVVAVTCPTPSGFSWSARGGGKTGAGMWAYDVHAIDHPEIVRTGLVELDDNFLITASPIARGRLVPTQRQIEAIQTLDARIRSLPKVRRYELTIRVADDVALIAIDLDMFLLPLGYEYTASDRAAPLVEARMRFVDFIARDVVPALVDVEEPGPIDDEMRLDA